MLVFIEFLRAIATLLIFNSHLKGVYPTDILSFGGGLGLALFYMLSGYLLSNINENTRFPKWYFKKTLRLYVPLIIFKSIQVILGYVKITSFLSFIKTFIFPTYWFVASMVIFYVLYYLFVRFVYKKFGKKSIIATWIFCGLSFIVLYITKNPLGLFSLGDLKFAEIFSVETPYVISQFIWFSSMLLGLYLKEFPINQTKMNNKKYLFLLSSVVCVLCFLGIRVFEKFGLNLEFLLPISYIGFASFLFLFFEAIEDGLKNLQGKFCYKPIEIISMCSLELYYVQFMIIEIFKVLKFPVNFVAILTIAVISSYVLYLISKKIIRMV